MYIYLCVYIKNIYKQLTGDHYGINIKICQIFFVEIRYVLIIIKGKTLTREPEMDKGCCFPHSSVGKESTCNAGDPSLIPGSGRSTVEGIGYPLQYSWASLVAQLVKNPPARRETWVQDLGSTPGLGRFPGEGKGATHSSFLGWRIPWTSLWGSQRVGHN